MNDDGYQELFDHLAGGKKARSAEALPPVSGSVVPHFEVGMRVKNRKNAKWVEGYEIVAINADELWLKRDNGRTHRIGIKHARRNLLPQNSDSTT